MGSKKLFFLIQTVIISSILNISCSQNLPQINSAIPSVVFEYSDYENPGTARMSLFVESIYNVRRCEYIQIKHIESGFTWDSSDVAMIQAPNNQYAGFSNLVVPKDEKIPTGSYKIRFIQSDGEESNLNVNVQYDASFYKYKASEIPEIVYGKNGINRISIYDSSNTLLYYGIRTEDLADNRGIWNKFRNAEYYYDIWCMPGNSVICIMPKEFVSNEKQKDE